MKKTISLFLVIAMMCTALVIPVGATSPEPDDVSQPDMEQYFTLTSDGLISFDTDAAANDGISQDYILFVQNNVEFMNALVLNNGAYINSEFHAVVYPNRPLTRSVNGGVTETRYSWDGATLIYLNSDDTKALIESLENGEDIVTFFTDLFGPIGHLFGDIYSGLNTITIVQLEVANRGNTGVVIKVKFNPDTGGQDVTIWSQ